MESLRLDLEYAARSIGAAPRFAAIVIVTLALGTGANTAVFSVLNAVVLKPLRYEEAGRLVRVYQASPGDNSGYLTGLTAVAYRDGSQTLDIAIAYTYSVQGADLTDGAEPERVTIMPVGADYFTVLGAHPILGQPFSRADERPNTRLAVVRGRTFGPEDHAQAPRRVVVSQELVRQLFPSEDPVGLRLRVAGADAEIIGVVGDVALDPPALPRPYVYHSHSQFAANRNWALTQTVALDADRPTLLSDVRRELSRIDPALVLHEPRMLEDVIGRGIAHERFALLLVASFALLALVLAAVGLYGVLRYSVSRRTRELSIRLALGAPVRTVRSMIVRDGARLAIVGTALGSIAALAATRSLQTLLFGVSATDPLAFVAAAGVLGGVAALASWIPARAATRADPMQAVRE